MCTSYKTQKKLHTTNNKKWQQQRQQWQSEKTKRKNMQQKEWAKEARRGEGGVGKEYSENRSNGRTEAETTTMGFDLCRCRICMNIVCIRIVMHQKQRLHDAVTYIWSTMGNNGWTTSNEQQSHQVIRNNKRRSSLNAHGEEKIHGTANSISSSHIQHRANQQTPVEKIS